VIASCGLCPWEVDFVGDTAAERGLQAHRVRHHGETLPVVTQMPNVVGWAEALEAARALAATGREFTIADLPDVEHHKTNKGRLTAEIHRLGIAHVVGYRPSRRATTKGSAAAVWHEDRARCIDPKCGPAREVSA
jgi:hypothetical protein